MTRPAPRILVVDDSTDISDLVSADLTDDGWEVETASGGTEALDKLATASVDVVLCDVNMPDMDGFEVLRRLHAEQPELCVVMHTTEGDGASVVRALRGGAFDYVVKSPDAEPLRAATRRAAEHTRIRRENTLLADALKAANVSLERRLRNAQEIAVANEKMASLGLLAAGVAHEINNPLAAVMSGVKYAKDWVGDLHQEGAADIGEALSDAQGAAQRIARIVRDLASYSRHPTGRLDLTDLDGAVDISLRLVPSDVKTGVDVDRQTSGANALASEGWLVQVLVNLLVNACHAMEKTPAGHKRLRIQTRLEGSSAVIEVTDTGCGIPESDRALVFDPFFTTKPTGKGTGLGLAVSRNLVEKMGGSIEFASEVGAGSIFRVRLRRSAPRAAGESGDAVETTKHGVAA